MSKYILAFLLGYYFRRFQMGPYGRAAKIGATRGTIKFLDEDFPDFMKRVRDTEVPKP